MKATTRDHVLIIYVTKQMERDNDSGDRPARDIEITPEMVRVGVAFLRSRLPERIEDDFSEVAQGLYAIMAAMREER